MFSVHVCMNPVIQCLQISTLAVLLPQVYYWRDSSQLRWLRVNRGMKSQVFPNNDPEPSAVITDLFPYSNYKMYIVVANNRYEGPPSNSIHFSTPEGGKTRQHLCPLPSMSKSQADVCFQSLCMLFPTVLLAAVPSAPRSFRIQQRHLDSIYVDWDLPAEPNGVITGYSLKYQTGMSTQHLKHSNTSGDVQATLLKHNAKL